MKTSQIDNRLVWGSLILIILGLFWNLGIYPLYVEEPRRALIALEMLLNNNWIVPTQGGEYYYRKPPGFNWLLMVSFKLFGNYSEWAVRFFSIIAHLATGGLVYWVGQRYVNRTFGVLAGILTLLSVDIFFFFAVVGGEIDLFYGLISFALFLAIFHFYEKRQFYTLFIVIYGLGALGTLTKGMPSLAFLGISLLVFFSYKRDFWKLFHPAHFVGFGIFVGILAAYFYGYHQYNSLDNYFATLWSQSADRTLQFSWTTFLTHIISYPSETVLKNTMPGTLLLVFLFRKDIRQVIHRNPFITFCVWILLSNFLLYWVSQGAKQRYLYMLYPFIIMICVYAYLQWDKPQNWRHFFLDYLSKGVLAIGIIGTLAIPFIPPFQNIPNLWGIAIGLCALLLGIAYCRTVITIPPIWLIILILAVGRIGFDLTVLEVKAKSDIISKRKKDAQEVYRIVKDAPTYFYNKQFDERWMGFTFYLTSYREAITPSTKDYNLNDFYIAPPESIETLKHKVLYQLEGNDLVLVRFL